MTPINLTAIDTRLRVLRYRFQLFNEPTRRQMYGFDYVTNKHEHELVAIAEEIARLERFKSLLLVRQTTENLAL